MVDPNQDCPKSSALALTGTDLAVREILEFYPPPPNLGEPVEPGQSDSNGNCPPRAPIEVPIVAELQIDGLTLQTVKRIPVYLSEVRRRNPELGDIEISDEGDGNYRLSIHIEPDSLDLECRDEALLPEAIRVYLYSTSGTFESASVDVVPSADERIDPAEVIWTASEETATLFFVAVDNDGGVDWKTVSL